MKYSDYKKNKEKDFIEELDINIGNEGKTSIPAIQQLPIEKPFPKMTNGPPWLKDWSKMDNNEKLGDGKIQISDVTKVAGWWERNSTTILAIVMLVGGSLGGNIDRIYNKFATPPDARFQMIEERLDGVERILNDIRMEHKTLKSGFDTII
jgi:hypothetical protein